MKYMDHFLQVRPNWVEVSLVGWFMFLIHLTFMSYNTSFLNSFVIIYYITNYLFWLLIVMGTIRFFMVEHLSSIHAIIQDFTTMEFSWLLIDLVTFYLTVQLFCIWAGRWSLSWEHFWWSFSHDYFRSIIKTMYEVHGSFATGSTQFGWG